MSTSTRDKFTVVLTKGNIRNGHVYLRGHLNRFPASCVSLEGRAPERCTLVVEGLGEIQTDIDASKGIFRWRGWRRFFQIHGLCEGDEVEIERTAGRDYVVRPKKVAMFEETQETDESDDERENGDGRENADQGSPAPRPRTRQGARRCNDLAGDEWLRFSISVWSDIRKTREELALRHPAMFPTALCERLIRIFLPGRGNHRILDPFMGSGSTLMAARALGKTGIGFEIVPRFVTMARQRLESPGLFGSANPPPYEMHECDARHLLQHVAAGSLDMCINSPPYWDILQQKRTADQKEVRHYGNLKADLGTIKDYRAFLQELGQVYALVFKALRPGSYCINVVMDLRKKGMFFPYHSDLACMMQELGFVYDDVVIWNRQSEYNNLRPLGYPSVFRINKVHEFVLIFRKPTCGK